MDTGQWSENQRELWDQVEQLWRLAIARDARAIEARLDPEYKGWVNGTPLPHGRAEAVASAVADTGGVETYTLEPVSISIYGECVGVVFYRYVAVIPSASENRGTVRGRWSETYLKGDEGWLLISVAGGPD